MTTTDAKLPNAQPPADPPREDLGDKILHLEARALHLNRRLAELFEEDGIGYQPAAVPDKLFSYGVLGGKDVGKSTLINSLAGSAIADAGDLLGEGTHMASVYVHQADVPAWHERCAEQGFTRNLKLIQHDRDVLRNVVLVDLPDFDSRFIEHLSYVRDFQKLLDGIAWIATPQKYKDNLLHQELRRVHREGFMFVLNKADWVIEQRQEATLDELRSNFTDAVRDALNDRIEARDIFVISAQKQLYDFPRLQQVLVREHSPEEIARRKGLNRLKELRALLNGINERFDLRRGAAGLEKLLTSIPDHVDQTFGTDYRTSVIDQLTELPEPHRRQSAGLLYHRLEGWPVLRTILWPLRLFITYVGGRIAHRTTHYVDYDALEPILDTGTLSLASRIENIRERIERDHRLVLDWLEKSGRVERTPGGTRGDVDRVISRLRSDLLRHDRERLLYLKDKHPPPGCLGRAMVWVPLLWFIVIQPIAEAALELANKTTEEGGSFSATLGTLLTIAWEVVKMVGAAALLEAVSLLVLIYAIWVIKIYADCSRWVTSDRRKSLELFWDENFCAEVAELWQKHYAAVTRQMTAMRDEWDELHTTVVELQELLREPESRRYMVVRNPAEL